jgi:glyoxylase-like metal-dependent hydrolase (beta-lactamase superfamily II)
MLIVDDYGKIHRIKMGRELDGKVLYWVAAWLADGLLFDTGCSYTSSELLGHLRGREVKVVVNSHHHEDHIGANRILARELGVEIFAHPLALPLLKQKPKLLPYQELVWGYPDPSEAQPLGDSLEMGGHHYRAIETAGHCPGHIALFEEQAGWIFGGDLFVTEKPRAIRPGENVRKMIADMRKLAGLSKKRLTLFTAMGDIVEDGRAALMRCADYLEDVVRKARDLNSLGLSAEEIRDKIFGRESALAGLTGGDFSIKNLVVSALQAEID